MSPPAGFVPGHTVKSCMTVIARWGAIALIYFGDDYYGANSLCDELALFQMLYI